MLVSAGRLADCGALVSAGRLADCGALVSAGPGGGKDRDPADPVHKLLTYALAQAAAAQGMPVPAESARAVA